MNYADRPLTVEHLRSNPSKSTRILDDHSSATSLTEMENSSSQSEELLGTSLDFERQFLGNEARHCRGLADSDDWDDSFAGEDSFAVHEGNGPYRAVTFRELVTVGEQEEEDEVSEESDSEEKTAQSTADTERK